MATGDVVAVGTIDKDDNTLKALGVKDQVTEADLPAHAVA